MFFYADRTVLHQHPAAAREVRSCDIIRTAHSPRHMSLEVTVVHHETFRNPEGRILSVVRYDGWELFGDTRVRKVSRGWGQVADHKVTVVGTTRELSRELLDTIESARIFGPRYPY